MQLNIMNTRVIALVAQSPERWSLAGDQLYIDLDLSEENLPLERGWHLETLSLRSRRNPTPAARSSWHDLPGCVELGELAARKADALAWCQCPGGEAWHDQSRRRGQEHDNLELRIQS
jgi:hypothetical protein